MPPREVRDSALYIIERGFYSFEFWNLTAHLSQLWVSSYCALSQENSEFRCYLFGSWITHLTETEISNSASHCLNANRNRDRNSLWGYSLSRTQLFKVLMSKMKQPSHISMGLSAKSNQQRRRDIPGSHNEWKIMVSLRADWVYSICFFRDQSISCHTCLINAY